MSCLFLSMTPLLRQWNDMQIRLQDCIANDDYHGVDKCTEDSMALIPLLIHAGVDITGLLR